LDAGGVSREFFFNAISELMDPAKGVFRTVEGSTYYPNDDFVVTDALQGSKERVLTFAGRLLGKALLEGHHVPAGFNGVLLKHLLALPVSLTDDLRLLDARGSLIGTHCGHERRSTQRPRPDLLGRATDLEWRP
jgi:hypothetical protein